MLNSQTGRPLEKSPIVLKPTSGRGGGPYRLSPVASIGGRVVNEDGLPLVNAQVKVGYYAYSNGIPRVQWKAATYTDRLGQYRLEGLAGRHYFVRAERAPEGYPVLAYAPLYYPGVSRVDVSIVHSGQRAEMEDPIWTVADGNGEFRAVNLVRGSYTVRASQNHEGRLLSAHRSIELGDKEENEVQLELGRGRCEGEDSDRERRRSEPGKHRGVAAPC